MNESNIKMVYYSINPLIGTVHGQNANRVGLCSGCIILGGRSNLTRFNKIAIQ